MRGFLWDPGVFMGPTQGPYILQLCMGPSYLWRGLTPSDPPLFRTLDTSLGFVWLIIINLLSRTDKNSDVYEL